MLPLKNYISNPRILGISLLEHCGRWLPDRLYIKMMYRFKVGRRLNLNNPQRFTEKLQWLKLYDRNPSYTNIVDKFEVKTYIANLIGKEYIIPTIGVWNRPEEIDWDSLPQRFVLKTTNGGGGDGIVICRNKSLLDTDKAIYKLNKNAQSNLYSHLREWPYKNIVPRIIAEEYLEDESGELRDYKFYCFGGIPKVMLIASNRFTEHNFNYYDMDFNQLPIHSAVGGKSNIVFDRPDNFEEMIELSKKLSQGFPHIRVDLYNVNNKSYFGELTFFDSSGYDNLNSDTVDLEWGSWIALPTKK